MVFVSPLPPVLTTIGALPPSAKLVYTVLAWSGQLTQKALIERTALPARTVRYALGRLRDERLITERFHLQDARQSLYAAVLPDTPSSDLTHLSVPEMT